MACNRTQLELKILLLAYIIYPTGDSEQSNQLRVKAPLALVRPKGIPKADLRCRVSSRVVLCPPTTWFAGTRPRVIAERRSVLRCRGKGALQIDLQISEVRTLRSDPCGDPCVYRARIRCRLSDRWRIQGVGKEERVRRAVSGLRNTYPRGNKHQGRESLD